LTNRILLAAAEAAARQAGTVLNDWQKRFSVTEKSRANLVTEADFAAQDAIHSLLKEQFPDHGFLGEEGLSESLEISDYRWIIDPLDGTSNYVHGFPYYAVSIGLEYQKELIVGVVFDPTRDELFTAIKGEGACLNGSSIKPSLYERLDQAMVIGSIPPGVQANDETLNRFLRVIPHAQTVQRTGSAALNLCYIASGRIDAYWSSSLKPWDMAAGVLILKEAGGKTTRMNGQPFDLYSPDLLSTNGHLIHGELEKLL
jgi:myo-inositol-1(or 4)-monophosphatase